MNDLCMPMLIGALLLCASLTRTSAHPGVGIVMDSHGNVFYTDLKQVWKIDIRGQQTIAVPHVHTHELYLDANDNLYGEHLWYKGEATDKWGHYVWKRTPSGGISKVIPDTEGFLKDYSFVRDRHDHMFFADREESCQKLMQRIPDRSVRLGRACFTDIRWMTATPGGNVYLVDSDDLKKVDANGNVHVMAQDIKERKLTQAMVNDNHLAMGLWTDKQENVYVAIYGARHVKKITPGKKVSVVAKTSLLWSPTGGLTTPNGDFWLLECSPDNSVRVEKITTKGERIIFTPGS